MIDLVGARQRLLLRRRIIVDVLEVDRRMADLGPARLALLALHLQPGAKGLQTPLQHPFRLALLARDEADGVLAQTLGQDVGFNVGDEAVFVFAAEIADCRSEEHTSELQSLMRNSYAVFC